MKTTLSNPRVKAAFLFAFAFFACTMSVFANPTNVSKFLLKQFQQQFKGATDITWKSTDNFTSATFTLNGEKTAVYYNNESNLVGVSKMIGIADLPKAARKSLNSKYVDCTLKSIIEFTDGDGDTNYYIELEKDGKQSILKSDLSGSMTTYKK